jgi:hypothetical protein
MRTSPKTKPDRGQNVGQKGRECAINQAFQPKRPLSVLIRRSRRLHDSANRSQIGKPEGNHEKQRRCSLWFRFNGRGSARTACSHRHLAWPLRQAARLLSSPSSRRPWHGRWLRGKNCRLMSSPPVAPLSDTAKQLEKLLAQKSSWGHCFGKRTDRTSGRRSVDFAQAGSLQAMAGHGLTKTIAWRIRVNPIVDGCRGASLPPLTTTRTASLRSLQYADIGWRPGTAGLSGNGKTAEARFASRRISGHQLSGHQAKAYPVGHRLTISIQTLH